MKKTLVIIIAICLAVVLCACSTATPASQTAELEELIGNLAEDLPETTTDVPQAEDVEEPIPEAQTDEEAVSYTPGEVQGNSFVNPYFDLVITWPEGWEALSVEDLNNIGDYAAEKGAYIDSELVEFQAGDGAYNNVNFTSQPDQSNLVDPALQAQVLEASYAEDMFIDSYTNLGAQNLMTSASVEVVAGAERGVGTITCDLVNEGEVYATLYQKQVYLAGADRSGIITLSGADEATVNEMLTMISIGGVVSESSVAEGSGESFWGSTCITDSEETPEAVSYAAIENGYFVLKDGNFLTGPDDNSLWDETNTTAVDCVDFKYQVDANAIFGSTGGDAEPEMMDVDSFADALDIHMSHSSGIGLVFHIENGALTEAWLVS